MATTRSGPRSNQKKRLLRKWTTATPVTREQHFLVTRVAEPGPPEGQIVFIEIEAMHSRRCVTLAWRELQDAGVWRHA